jgi:hypothetical protein
MGHQLHPQHLPGDFADFFLRFRQLNSTAFASTAGVDLSFDHYRLTAQCFSDLHRLFDCERNAPFGHRYSELSKDLLPLIFVNFHFNLVDLYGINE